MPALRKDSGSDIIGTVRRTLTAYGMVQPGDRLLLAVSGGMDSVVLTHIMHRISREYHLILGVAHLNHGLRGAESDADARFSADLAKRLSLPFFTDTVDVEALRRSHKTSIEEAGRTARYRFFTDIARQEKYTKIATAHHADDNAELVLMFLLRGSGPDGLAGMAPVRDCFIRPLLRVSRSHLIDYARVNGLTFVSDASNQDPAFTRNRIRHHLLPTLAAGYNPDIATALNRLADILFHEGEWLEKVVGPLLESCVTARGPGFITLDAQQLTALPFAARRRVLRKAILMVKNNLRRITFDHVDAILSLETGPGEEKHLHLPDRVRVLRTPDRLTLIRESIPLRCLPKGLQPPEGKR